MIYYGRYMSQLIYNMSEKSQAKPLFNFEKLPKTVSNVTIVLVFLNIVNVMYRYLGYVFGYQESIVDISLILNTKSN